MTLGQYAATQPRLAKTMNDEIAIRLAALIVNKIREWGDTILYGPIDEETNAMIKEYREEVSSEEFDRLTLGNGSLLLEEFNKKLELKMMTEEKAVS